MEKEPRTRAQRIELYEETVISFLLEAAAEGADQKLPPSLTKEQWERRKNIGKAYIYLPYTLEDLGKIYGYLKKPLTIERIRQIHRAFIVNLYNNFSPELQGRFPLQNLFVRKPSRLRSKAIFVAI